MKDGNVLTKLKPNAEKEGFVRHAGRLGPSQCVLIHEAWEGAEKDQKNSPSVSLVLSELENEVIVTASGGIRSS